MVRAMNDSSIDLSWDRFQSGYAEFPQQRLALDLSKVHKDYNCNLLDNAEMASAFEEMRLLESGAIANVSENRRVGHYWLRAPELAPEDTMTAAIRDAKSQVERIAKAVLSGALQGSSGPFERLLVIGIGGSALGPQFVDHALADPDRRGLATLYVDNTDPAGIELNLQRLKGQLGQTLVIVISKSGGTKETRNGMLEVQHAYTKCGLAFPKHAIAITGSGSALDQTAAKEGWLERLPMWDWVGGRTSVTSTVGLLPMALQGSDINAFLEGAAIMDEQTRIEDVHQNPAAGLASAWYAIGQGKGLKRMVVLPYSDRLELFAKYLQQLVMESIGKKLNRKGHIVHQGISVFGNKGSTDQHAYVQQLRDGTNDFFVTFVEVLKSGASTSFEVDPGIGSADYLAGFCLGTRQALADADRESITMTIPEVSEFTLGGLIALYERAVGFYASLIDINAYDQPGVEAGKKAAESILQSQREIMGLLQSRPGEMFHVEQIPALLNHSTTPELVYKILRRLSTTHPQRIQSEDAPHPASATFGYTP